AHANRLPHVQFVNADFDDSHSMRRACAVWIVHFFRPTQRSERRNSKSIFRQTASVLASECEALALPLAIACAENRCADSRSVVRKLVSRSTSVFRRGLFSMRLARSGALCDCGDHEDDDASLGIEAAGGPSSANTLRTTLPLIAPP